MKHRYDNRGSGPEGDLAEMLYEKTCKAYGENFRKTSKKENYDGVDIVHSDKKVDVKARKKRLPAHWCWIEVSAADDNVGTGWIFKDKWIAQMMVYSENNLIKDAIYGRYHTKDMVELLNKKMDFYSDVSFRELYKVYNRYDYKTKKHRGATTCVAYQDIESLNSFEKMQIPKEYWNLLVDEYEYDGVI